VIEDEEGVFYFENLENKLKKNNIMKWGIVKN
jgi:hypothetical protein